MLNQMTADGYVQYKITLVNLKSQRILRNLSGNWIYDNWLEEKLN